ncbi:MAG: hypothetical protein JSW62_04855 [Thermoplasmatales archaeon]|nr:MAG: hypothetical protein JSW62_04855 [Thermoplasmatales archaeon]
MIGGNVPNLFFQTFYISKEELNNPFILDIVRTGKKISEFVLLQDSSIIISLGYGKRILINGLVEDFSNIKRSELIEIVDYDPVKNNLLVIGPNEPCLESPLHWMIHHAREDVSAVVQLNNVGLIEKIKNKYPETEKERLPGTFDQIKEVLRLLREERKIIIKNQGFLFIGKTLNEVEEEIEKTIEDLK